MLGKVLSLLSSKRKRILLVDDDRFLLELVEAQLKAYAPDKYLASLVQEPKDALELIEKSRDIFDVIILDIRMRGMNGVELARKIRKIQAYKEVPIIFLSAGYTESALKALEKEFTHSYSMTKPVNPALFLKLIQEACTEKELGQMKTIRRLPQPNS